MRNLAVDSLGFDLVQDGETARTKAKKTVVGDVFKAHIICGLRC